MGYRIIYAKEKYRFRQLSKRKRILIITIAVSACLIAFGCFGGTGKILPGDPNASDALESLVESVQGGEDISDAVVAFCREIIANAQKPQ